MVARSALLFLSRQEGLKDFATKFRPFQKMTTRFVAGEDIETTVRAIRDLNAHGCTRTFDDVREMLKIPARIRLCKGAYNEPPEVAFPDKRDVDENYVRCMKLMLGSGVYHGIATHDERMIAATKKFAQAEGIG